MSYLENMKQLRREHMSFCVWHITLTYRPRVLNLAEPNDTFLLQSTWPSLIEIVSQIASFMGPTWGPPEAGRTQAGAMLAPWTLQSGVACCISGPRHYLNQCCFLYLIFQTNVCEMGINIHWLAYSRLIWKCLMQNDGIFAQARMCERWAISVTFVEMPGSLGIKILIDMHPVCISNRLVNSYSPQLIHIHNLCQHDKFNIRLSRWRDTPPHPCLTPTT